MRVSFRDLIVLIAAFWLGTWMSLRNETPSHASTQRMKDRRAPQDLPVQSLDLSNVPDKVPWPRLNPEASSRKAWLLAEGPYRDQRDGKRLVTFTFDDGPVPETTPTVLRMLAAYNIKATFFVIGQYLEGDSSRAQRSREVLRDVARQGHLVGNHTLDHRLLTTRTHAEAQAQIDRSALAIEQAIGSKPILFRPPYGQVDDYTMELLRERKQELVLWSLEANDMQTSDIPWMIETLKAQIEYRGGGSILLHDVRGTTIPVLREVLLWLHEHKFDPKKPHQVGYEIVDMPTYIKETALSPQPFADRQELEVSRASTWRRKHPHRAVPLASQSEGAELAL